jgi:SAM-dependent methyltransferase
MDARAWDERYAASELVWSATPNQFVASELEALRPGRALDLAAGEGRNALWLAERGWQVTAVDFSLAGLDKGRTLQERHERGRDLHVDWVHADVLGYDSGPVPYDLVVLAYLQLTDDERRTAVRRAFGALQVGGTFFLVAHDATNLTEGTGGPTSAEVLYTAEDVLADLDGERFDVERAERVERLVPPADPVHTHEGDESRTAYDALVRLVRTG